MRPRWRVATYAPGGRPIGHPAYFVRRRNAQRYARELAGVTPRIPEGDRVSNPQTVTITVPWEDAKWLANFCGHLNHFPYASFIEACREATKPKPRFVMAHSNLWWLIRNVKENVEVAHFIMDTFTKDDAQAICKRLNEGEK